MTILFEVVLLSIAGFLCGFIGSQVGAGAIFTVPALLALGLPLPFAIATQSISGEVINGVAAYSYWKKKKLNIKKALPFAFLASIGSYLGAKLLFKLDLTLA